MLLIMFFASNNIINFFKFEGNPEKILKEKALDAK